jgi:hypothetical protein
VLLAVVAALLAIAAAVGSRWSDEPPILQFRAGLHACDILEAAFGPNRVPNNSRGDHPPTRWDATVCVNDTWDATWGDRHLFLRRHPTDAQAAADLIARRSLWEGPHNAKEGFSTLEVQRWREIAEGAWLGESGDGRVWFAVAVSAEPYFFVVTAERQDPARIAALAVAAELGVDLSMPPSPWEVGP